MNEVTHYPDLMGKVTNVDWKFGPNHLYKVSTLSHLPYKSFDLEGSDWNPLMGKRKAEEQVGPDNRMEQCKEQTMISSKSY